MSARAKLKAAKKAPRRAVNRTRPVRSRARSAGTNKRISRSAMPIFLSLCIVFCLGVLGFLGYRSVAASDFFNVTGVEVSGTNRSSKQDIEKIVVGQTERSGVWNADLVEIKARVEKLPFVETAAVSRVLPNRIRISVLEREPKAIVRLANGDFLVDEQGNILSEQKAEETKLPFVLVGWDEAKTEAGFKENIARVKMYQKMLSEWNDLSITGRVRMVNLANLREPRAITEDSGMTVSIALGGSNFGENLKNGIKAIVGKGNTFEAVNLVGTNMILAPRKGSETVDATK